MGFFQDFVNNTTSSVQNVAQNIVLPALTNPVSLVNPMIGQNLVAPAAISTAVNSPLTNPIGASTASIVNNVAGTDYSTAQVTGAMLLAGGAALAAPTVAGTVGAGTTGGVGSAAGLLKQYVANQHNSTEPGGAAPAQDQGTAPGFFSAQNAGWIVGGIAALLMLVFFLKR